MTTTLAGLPVLSLALTIPLRGAWSANVALEGEASLSGDVALVIEGRTWTGRVHRGGNELGRWQGQLVGAGAILAELDPQAFQGSTLREVFVETLRAAGLSASADTGDLSALANHWHRLSGPASRTLAAVADAAGYGWRVLADGTVWTGPETWAAQALTGTPVDVLDVDPAIASTITSFPPGYIDRLRRTLSKASWEQEVMPPSSILSFGIYLNSHRYLYH